VVCRAAGTVACGGARIADDQTSKIRIGELMPRATELNAEAYRLIRDIEILARNFVAVQLCLRCENDQPLLRTDPRNTTR